ncbi:MAG: malto-oligosyltrehalose trehalohydrolase [Candidatus Korobacteraceae bacterium]
MGATNQNLSYGATLRAKESYFRVWAPVPQEITLRLTRVGAEPQDIPMRRDGEDFLAVLAAAAGDRYAYILDDGSPIPDPVSRFLPEGVLGPSEIVDPAAFQWTDDAWRGLALREYIIYELHVGTFTLEGTFDSAIAKLEYLKQLGITVVEVMPVSAFPGERNWGYDGVSPYAVQASYGGPDGFKRFIDAAHSVGLAVILDVVYNHLGPEGNYLRNFGPYFTTHHKTPWGDAVNYDAAGCEHVRRYVVENALYWIREYHLDGLRLDAVQTIKDDSPKHILAEIQERVQLLARELKRTVNVIAETDENDSRYTRAAQQGGYGLDAVWSDDFHHAVHAYFTGEQQGYYQGFGEPEQIARALREGYVFQGEHYPFWNAPRGSSAKDVPLPANIIGLQNHDQVGNRAKGERLSTLTPRGARKLATALLLLAPHTPLLFMGEEYDETAPFQFFADFQDPELSKAVSQGRRSEFKDFDFSEVPDPEDPETFRRSKLTWDAGPQHRDMLEWYRQLLRLRKQHVTDGQRTADAQYAEGVLTMQVSATNPKIMVQAALERGRSLPNLEEGWREVLRSDEDGYAVNIWVR